VHPALLHSARLHFNHFAISRHFSPPLIISVLSFLPKKDTFPSHFFDHLLFREVFFSVRLQEHLLCQWHADVQLVGQALRTP
jgi:hypothetical protein